jgi:hypothetical protein
MAMRIEEEMKYKAAEIVAIVMKYVINGIRREMAK